MCTRLASTAILLGAECVCTEVLLGGECVCTVAIVPGDPTNTAFAGRCSVCVRV
jgi:hypothetical protein